MMIVLRAMKMKSPEIHNVAVEEEHNKQMMTVTKSQRLQHKMEVTVTAILYKH